MPIRLAKLRKALAQWGISVQPGKGSHLKFIDAKGTTYPVPAHNGEKSEVSNVYIDGAARAFGLDAAKLRHGEAAPASEGPED